MILRLNQFRYLTHFMIMVFIILSNGIMIIPYIIFMTILTYTNFFPLDDEYQNKLKQIFEMWEKLIPWLKTCSLFIAFIHIMFHLPHFIDFLPDQVLYLAGYVNIDNPLCLLRLIIVILLFMVNCYQSNIHIVFK